jgi:hypothetical protein
MNLHFEGIKRGVNQCRSVAWSESNRLQQGNNDALRGTASKSLPLFFSCRPSSVFSRSLVLSAQSNILQFVIFFANASFIVLIRVQLITDDWQEHNNNLYLFVMDAARQLDQTREDAMTQCQAKNANLVSMETEDEMAFIKRKIQQQESIIGQESLNDQWWTAGIALNGDWVWDNADLDPSECFPIN